MSSAGACECPAGGTEDKKSGFRPNRSTTGMTAVIRRLQELARKKRVPLYMYALWALPNRTTPLIEPSSGQYSPVLECHKIYTILVIRQFYYGMQACVWFDDGVCSEWFAVEQGLNQGCVLAPLLFNIFATVINVIYTRFKADKDIMDALVHLRKKTGVGGA